MAVYLTRKNGTKFTVNPTPVRSMYGEGWVIQCHADDPNLYGGKYVANVGFASSLGPNNGYLPFRTKRDAVDAINVALYMGVYTKR